jgi:integrase
MDGKHRITKGTTDLITEALVTDAGKVMAKHGSPDELNVRDRNLKGFVLRLRATGRHAYAVAYGRGKLLTLGTTDKLTAGKAREAARNDLAERSLAEDREPDRVKRKRAAMTLRLFLAEHYEPWARGHLKTAGETLARLRVNFAEMLDTRLADIAPFAVERWRTARLRAGLSRATVNRDVVALKAALSKAVEWRKVTKLASHPLAGAVKPYRLDGGAVARYLTSDEETRLLKALDARDERRRSDRDSHNEWRRARHYKTLPAFGTYTDHLSPLVRLALNTGLRRGELFGLCWRDVDLPRAVLTVRGSGTKSGHTRYIPLNTRAVEVLEQWRGNAKAAADAPVFVGEDGEPLVDVKKGWLAVVKAAKLEDFRFHDLRHSFASKLVMAGVDLNTVRELLGHADLKMTLRYAHLAPEAKAAAVAKLV